MSLIDLRTMKYAHTREESLDETPLRDQPAGHARARARRVHRQLPRRERQRERQRQRARPWQRARAASPRRLRRRSPRRPGRAGAQLDQDQGNGHGNASKQSATSPQSPATGGSNSQGVKPSSTTKHDTYAKASSDETKKYGNGKTAGQIATQAGYGDATLHGPGNSQPHKTMCGGHEVDVHALKHKGSKCGTTTPSTSAPATPPATSGSSVSSSAHEHVTICHATGSSSNPYVRISPSASGVFHGHLGHQDGRDIIPPFTYDGQTYSQNWDTAGQGPATTAAACPRRRRPSLRR